MQPLAYPEPIDERWRSLLQEVPSGIGNNPNRKHSHETEVPKDWHGYVPRMQRSGLHCNHDPLPDSIKREILREAKTREHFHDYDKIHDARRRRIDCLCELRLITGCDCFEHISKGSDGKTVGMPNNQHWAWTIDVAPRGFVCPRAKEYHEASMGGPTTSGCPILLFDKPPPEDWVLAQDSNDPTGTPAGRACDIVLPGKCEKCQGKKVDDKTHELLENQRCKAMKYLGGLGVIRQPVKYQPDIDSGSVVEHALLEPGNYYTLLDLTSWQPSIPWSDIWLEHVRLKNGKKHKHGCTY
jgi:hypothetical protein